MLNIYVLMGTPTKCEACGKPFHKGQRIVTDGEHDFDTCQCYTKYHGLAGRS
jgi:hypothetical protein